MAVCIFKRIAKGAMRMTFYQELQLSSTGSKQLIRNTTDKKEKRRHILIYNFKVYLVMAFCVAVVTLYSKITGRSNRTSGRAGFKTGGFRDPDHTRPAVHCRDLQHFDYRTAAVQHGFTGAGIFCKCRKHSFTDDSGMPQCDHV